MPALDVDLDLQPTRHEDGSVSYDVGGATVRVRRSGTGWDYTGPGGSAALHLEGLDGEGRHVDGRRGATGDSSPLRFGVRLAQDEAVARFATPVFVPRFARTELWIAWPLEVVVVAGDHEIDRLLPGRRQTLFGTVNEGRVLPTAVCEPVLGPADPALAGRPRAALSVRIHNRGKEPARLSRVPVNGALLALHRAGDSFAATAVKVDLQDGGQAEASAQAGLPPEGFTTVAEPPPQTGQIAQLGWLLDATRRSVEYPL